MSRCRSLGVMIDTRLGIYVQARKHTAGPPVDTMCLLDKTLFSELRQVARKVSIEKSVLKPDDIIIYLNDVT
ncbi:hypothetical protein ACTXT7_002108 [Hymenolepis weldensis]